MKLHIPYFDTYASLFIVSTMALFTMGVYLHVEQPVAYSDVSVAGISSSAFPIVSNTLNQVRVFESNPPFTQYDFDIKHIAAGTESTPIGRIDSTGPVRVEVEQRIQGYLPPDVSIGIESSMDRIWIVGPKANANKTTLFAQKNDTLFLITDAPYAVLYPLRIELAVLTRY